MGPSGAASAGVSRPVRTDGKVAVLLIQEGVEAFVVAGGKIEQSDERTVAAARFLQTTIDQCSQFGACDFVRPERLLNNFPEIAARHQLVPQMLRDQLAVRLITRGLLRGRLSRHGDRQAFVAT